MKRRSFFRVLLLALAGAGAFSGEAAAKRGRPASPRSVGGTRRRTRRRRRRRHIRRGQRWNSPHSIKRSTGSLSFISTTPPRHKNPRLCWMRSRSTTSATTPTCTAASTSCRGEQLSRMRTPAPKSPNGSTRPTPTNSFGLGARLRRSTLSRSPGAWTTSAKAMRS